MWRQLTAQSWSPLMTLRTLFAEPGQWEEGSLDAARWSWGEIFHTPNSWKTNTSVFSTPCKEAPSVNKFLKWGHNQSTSLSPKVSGIELGFHCTALRPCFLLLVELQVSEAKDILKVYTLVSTIYVLEMWVLALWLHALITCSYVLCNSLHQWRALHSPWCSWMHSWSLTGLPTLITQSLWLMSAVVELSTSV